MLARKCDRCGKLYEEYAKEYKGAYKKINGVDLVKNNVNGGRITYNTYDLCPACMESLILFIADPDAEVIGKIEKEDK